MHILICDDDASTRFVLRRFLTRDYGCAITECENGRLALAMLASSPVDLVILDLNMPVLDGLSTLELIRANPATAGLRVLILTEERGEQTVRRAAALGVAGFCAKPLSASRLRDKLDPLFGRPDRVGA